MYLYHLGKIHSSYRMRFHHFLYRVDGIIEVCIPVHTQHSLFTAYFEFQLWQFMYNVMWLIPEQGFYHINDDKINLIN